MTQHIQHTQHTYTHIHTQACSAHARRTHIRTPPSDTARGIGHHNYCRNPDKETSAWCYTTDSDVRWDYCGVPECDTAGGFFKSATGQNGAYAFNIVEIACNPVPAEYPLLQMKQITLYTTSGRPPQQPGLCVYSPGEIQPCPGTNWSRLNSAACCLTGVRVRSTT